jgi:hypothetical protein
MPTDEIEDLFTVISLLDQEFITEAEKKAKTGTKGKKKKGLKDDT